MLVVDRAEYYYCRIDSKEETNEVVADVIAYSGLNAGEWDGIWWSGDQWSIRV